MNRLTKNNPFSCLNKVTEEIYHLTVRYPFAMRETNSYLFLGDKGFTVVDTGSMAEESMAIWKNVIDSGITIEKIVCTHAHPDHIGLASWFQKNYQIPVYTSALSYKEIQYKRTDKDLNWLKDLFQQHGGPEEFRDTQKVEAEAYEFDPDGLFEIGENIRLGNEIYETFWTPGHARDHVCFYNREQQVMVLGDVVLQHLSPIVGPFSERDVNPLKDYFETLAKIGNYPTKISLPGHGALIDNLQARITEIESRHKYRLDQIVELLRKEPKTGYQIYLDVYGEIGHDKYFSPYLATISRVVYLESIGEISSKIIDGKIYYYRK